MTISSVGNSTPRVTTDLTQWQALCIQRTRHFATDRAVRSEDDVQWHRLSAPRGFRRALTHLSAEVSRAAREALATRMLSAAADVPAVRDDPGEGAIRRMQAIGRAYIEFAVSEPHLFDTAFMAAGAAPSCADDPSEWGVLNDALDALVRTGVLAVARRETAALVAWSAVHGLSGVLVRPMLPAPYQPNDAITATLAGVLDALDVRQPREMR